jgi:hypothetical protein
VETPTDEWGDIFERGAINPFIYPMYSIVELLRWGQGNVKDF